VLPTRWYVALWAGVCVLAAVLGAVAKNYGPELGGGPDAWGWAALPVMCLVGGVIARRVGNPTAPILCGAMVAMTTLEPAHELGQSVGGVWGRRVVGFLLFLAVYLLWATVVHPRLAGRRTP
jgi:hypothetical protein